MFLRIPGPPELQINVLGFFSNLEVESQLISEITFLFVLKMCHIQMVTLSFFHPVLCGI